MKHIKILIVDDHKMFLEGMQSILQDIDFIETIDTASNGKQALTLIKSIVPDVTITDLDMPNIDGVELTKTLKSEYPDMKIIAVSSHYSSHMIATAINAGVNGYIIKNTGKTELLKAISLVHKGTNYFGAEVKQIMSNSIFNKNTAETSSINLSNREIEVLALISEEKNTQEIADNLFISVNTVETHRKNLMRKIGTKNMVGLVKYAIQQNII